MKKKIALVTGGYSRESEISYKSAKTIEAHVNRQLYDVFVIDISASGWWCMQPDGTKLPVNKADFTIEAAGTIISFDAVLFCIHGTPGEDGKLQGYFDILNLPYTSCDAATSAITFNKRYTVAVVAFSGISVAKSMHVFHHTPVTATEILQTIQLPVFIKPNNGGSSIGMSKVNDAAELMPALEKAFKEDTQVLVEEYIAGREFTIGVFKTGGNIIVLPITEVMTEKDFFDFEAKYQGKSKEITPAIIPAEWQNKLEAAARKVYEVLNCRGIVRMDFIWNEARQTPYLLEVNTIPGQSEASIVPQQVKAMGWSLQEFYTRLIEEAFNKY
ncbi:MAG: D-alanine--D-alanine ligase [Sphingobacteriales bacterium]|uniref:D-alanine--D-alanine ligase n=1 Tax=Hydrotalea flava TaxID=714549 RepID=UPI000833EA7A|nr:D-alanine--D-alanine ligase [Hydrotalea flava]RTL47498.1 MAG: D-alanine--D-alanine ligase [Sphingobacteriales bacterium]